MQNLKSEILYTDKKRTNKWLSLNRLQLPVGENQYGSIKSITYKGAKVKIKEDAFLFADKEKSQSLLSGSRLQLLGHSNSFDFNTIIDKRKHVVNKNSEGKK